MEKFLHAFNLVPGMGYATLAKIWTHFRDWERAWETAQVRDYLNAGLTEEMALKTSMAYCSTDVDKEYEALWEKDIVLIARGAQEYPEALQNIPAPPFLLYRKGAPLLKGSNLMPDTRYVSIVGTRMPSTYGEKMALKIAEGLALSGGIVVSGLAFGIDAVAHFGAVKNGRPTVAVLASGLNFITPASHNSLAQKILETGGTLVSEYAGKVTFKDNFLWRNRIISGLSKVTIVIEAKEKSGALITAKHAEAQGRDVFALVADITRPQAQGCLKLLIEGRALGILGVEDLLQCLGFESTNLQRLALTAEEEMVIRVLLERPCSTEDLLDKTKLQLSKVNVLLTQLELKGAIKKNKAFLWEVLL